MRQEEQQLLSLLTAHLHPSQATPALSILDSCGWEAVFRLASAHHILPMVYDAAQPYTAQIPSPLLAACRSAVLQTTISQTQKTHAFLQLYRQMRAAGLTVLVVKGLVCRSLYPNPDLRPSSDEDLYIAPDEFDRCHDLLTGMGFAAQEGDAVTTYQHTETGLHLELHTQLFPSGAYAHLNRLFDGVLAHPLTLHIQDTDILSMPHSQHFLFLICHAFKHFLHSGFGIRQVCDILCYADAYGDAIDWTSVRQQLASIHADVFARNLMDIGCRRLGFSAAHCGWELSGSDIDSDDLLADLFSAGVFGSSSASRQHSSTITLRAFSDAADGKRAKATFLRSAFPPAAELTHRYPILKRAPVVLPLCWLHRLAVYAAQSRNSQTNSAAESIKIGSQRVELLKKYGIIH